MKKYAYLLILLPFILLGCKNPTVPEVEPEAESDSTTSFTAKELLENLPESIESFEKQLFSSNARKDLPDPEPIDFSKLPSVTDIDYYCEVVNAEYNMSASSINVILSALKNSVSKIENITLDSTCDITAKSVPELSTFMNFALTDSGYINVTYKDGLAKINWLFKVNIGSKNNARKTKGFPGKMIFSIIGNYKNGKYENITFLVTQQAQGMNMYSTSSISKKGDSVYEVLKTDGEEEIVVIKKNKDGSYVNFTMQPEKYAKSEKSFFDKICLKTANGYAYYDAEYNLNITDNPIYLYYAFDTDGSLLMEETNNPEWLHLEGNVTDKFYQAIPLNNLTLVEGGESWIVPYLGEYGSVLHVEPNGVYQEGVWYGYQKILDDEAIQFNYVSKDIYTEDFNTDSGEIIYYPCLVNKEKTDVANIDFTTDKKQITENLTYKPRVKDKIASLIQSVEKEKAAKADFVAVLPAEKTISEYSEEILEWSNTIQ